MCMPLSTVVSAMPVFSGEEKLIDRVHHLIRHLPRTVTGLKTAAKDRNPHDLDNRAAFIRSRPHCPYPNP